MDNAIFIDSWAWVALANQNDPEYHLARRRFNSISKEGLRLFTSDYVLDEAFTQIFQDTCTHNYKCSPIAYEFVKKLFEGITSKWLTLERIDKHRFESAKSLRGRFEDKPDISFTDLTSFVVMNELGLRNVFTDDQHFERVNMGFNIWRDEI